ncbi:MAG TPA: 50S ribosomal protein L11 methyltransferase [Bacteroidales bacterium]|nr:50S ribosomal protein L11 methyltransferase [Bacteroidales bacterium]
MKYKEISIKFSEDWSKYDKEIYMAYLLDKGFDSFYETENEFKAYIIKEKYNNNIFNSLPLTVKNLSKPIIYAIDLPNVNWNENWEKNFNPIVIANQLSIRASFHPLPSNIKYDIIINPKMSFGTGHHETTSLVAQLMLDCDFCKYKVLDMGCGTGVLAILAKIKGANEVWAIDNDKWAYQNCIENCKINNCNDIKIILGDANNIPSEVKFDFIIANINRNVLINDMQFYIKALNKYGTLIISGFFKEDIEIINSKINNNGVVLKQVLEKNKWVACKYLKIS